MDELGLDRDSRQWTSQGDSCPELHEAALQAARARPDLTWLDIGCGTGEVLRRIHASYRPARLIGLDVIDWLADDLRPQVELSIGPAEQLLADKPLRADRVLLVETLEHVDSPWRLLRAAARCVIPGGRIVITTPNIASLRHRVELLTRGRLTAFRPDNLPHMTPILTHVVGRVLDDEGLVDQTLEYAGRDIVPWAGGRRWPLAVQHRFPRGTSISVVITADLPV